MDYFKEANILYREERYDEAINLYKKAIEQNPDFVWHHCNLGLAFIEIGNYKEATNALEKACNIEPGISELNELLTNLRTPYLSQF